ncbi:MAG: choice-of-anchor I family protein [Roseovarius sp.]|nr:choice-of-anchor I family protein [Roseovarius sp.]
MFTLQLLHANDLEGGVEALDSAPNFAAIVDTLEDTQENTILLSAGDNYIPGPFFSTAADFSMGGTLTDAYTRLFDEVTDEDLTDITLDLGRGGGRVDVSIMNILDFDASAVGNHEFDPGTTAFSEIINAEGGEGVIEWVGASFPYLTSNIDFSGDGALGGLFTDEILDSGAYDESLADLAAGNIGPAIAPATTIALAEENVGVVGATTQLIETISSTGGTNEITGGVNDMAALAEVIQPQIDAMLADGVNKVILTSHLQQIELEKELAGLLNGVDIIIAGGSNTLQADDEDRLRDGDEAAESYPFVTENADGDPVALVSTDGEYSYLGRLVAEFDESGVLMPESIDETVSGTFATDEQGVLDVTGEATLDAALANSAKADIVEDLTSAVQAIVDQADSVVFGAHDVFLDGRRETVRTEESNLGNLSADANLAAAREVDDTVMVSFKNGGGIRAEIGSATDTGTDAGDGLLSQLDLQNSLRFDNGLTMVTLAPEGLLMLLEHAVADTDTEAGNTPGRFLQIGGFRVSFDEDGAAQELVTDEAGNYVVDPDTGMPQVTTEGTRIETVSLVDPATGEDIVIVRDGALTGAAPESVRMVTLNFLVENNGDGYPFQELASDITYLTRDGGTTTDPEAEDILGEQEALGDYMAANFPDADTAFARGETDVFNDARIVQLARNGDVDRILLDEEAPGLGISVVNELVADGTEADAGDSEVVSAEDGIAYVTNGAQDRVDVFDIASGDKLDDFDLSVIEGFDGVQSVAVKNGLVAVAVAVTPEDANGQVALFDTDGTLLNTVEVGNLPDMVTFTPDGGKVLVANEGEPLDETDPLGGVSIIDVSNGAAEAQAVTLDFTGFDGQEDALREAGVLLEPEKSVSEDLEPEYITVLPDGETAWVSLQEANAYAVVDLVNMEVSDIRGFGLVDRSEEGFELDASNDDNAINLQNYDNLFGMRQPDAISAAEIDGTTYIFTANEGDARDATEADIEDLELDPEAFPNADILQQEENLGKLEVRSDLGDTDGDGDYDQLYHYGARSFTIYDEAGEVVFDSGSQFSQLVAEIRPELFNEDEGEFDGRSDNKGVEPEAVAVGVVEGTHYAFIGLERDSGVMVFDLSDPSSPVFDQYIAGDATGNNGPETIDFIPASDSTSGLAQIAVAYEGDDTDTASDSTVVFELDNLSVDNSATGRTDAPDTLVGDEGDDILGAGPGDDLVNGNGGNDSLGGGFDNDVVNGGAGNDTIGGGFGDDAVSGGADDDFVNGGFGTDHVLGETGNDTIGGGGQNDTVLGGEGDDLMGGGTGMDLVSGGLGNDSLGGGEGNDTVTGDDGDDFVAGGGRDDLVDGGAGDDTVNGGNGDDTMTGGDGDDMFVFNTVKAGEVDIITDFEDGAEVLRLTGVTFDDLSITDGEDGAEVALAGHTIVLEGVSAADLSQDDFMFL